MYSLDCEYFKSKFETIPELVEAVLFAGQDPSYEILEEGIGIGETVADHLIE